MIPTWQIIGLALLAGIVVGAVTYVFWGWRR